MTQELFKPVIMVTVTVKRRGRGEVALLWVGTKKQCSTVF